MAKNKKLHVQGSEITVFQAEKQDYISLTDIAKHKTDDSSAVIGNWMRNRNTIEFLSIWETHTTPILTLSNSRGLKGRLVLMLLHSLLKSGSM